MSNKPKQGDTLYLDITKVSKEPIAQPVTVAKVGRKYFYVSGSTTPFCNDTLAYVDKNFSHLNEFLYRTQQEIHDMHQRIYLRGVISIGIQYKSHLLSLDQLQRISNILNEK